MSTSTDLQLGGLKKSESLKLQAAIVEVMEDAGFDVSGNVDITTGEDDKLSMSFIRTTTISLEEISSIKEKLGDNFSVVVKPKDKTSLIVGIEATQEDFIKILSK